MLAEPRTLHNIAHPFIDTIYIKKEFADDAPDGSQDVLVIETKRGGAKKERKELLSSFLADLDLIKDEVEKKAGKFARVDIKCH